VGGLCRPLQMSRIRVFIVEAMDRAGRVSVDSLKRISWAACIFSLVLLTVFLFARHTLGGQYANYDDEGYVLLSLKHYLSGEHLYTQVFSQYGPFYYLAEGTLFRILHLPVTHDSGRLLTLMLWLLSSAGFMYFVYKLSGNALLAGAAGTLGTWLEAVLANEPNHPQQVVLPMLVLACCAALTPTPSAFAVLAALGVGLVFTKINIGVFYLVALFGTLACGLPKGALRRTAIGLCGIYLLLFPPLLMHRDFSWARWYCLVTVICGLSSLTAGVATSPEMRKSRRAWLYAVAGGIGAAVVIVGVTMMQGVSAGTLFRGVVLDPLRHSGRFVIPALVMRKDAFVAILITATIVAVYKLRRRPETYAMTLCSLRFLLGSWGIFLLFHSGAVHPTLVAALPIALLPPASGRWEPKDYFPRMFVTLLSATQLLQPYPVAGSQCSIAAAPLLLWCFICFHDGIEGGLAELVRRRTGGFHGDLSLVSVLGGLVLAVVAVQMLSRPVLRQRFANPPSILRGSQSLHLPEEEESVYVPIATEISANCDVLFSLPGMGSFNFWSEVPSPNGFNHNAWVTHFSLEEQRSILATLQANRKSCVLYNPEILLFWQTTPRDVEASPLATYIVNDMPMVYQRQNYQIRVNPNRQSPWVEADPRRN
jgi:hypothetical protein